MVSRRRNSEARPYRFRLSTVVSAGVGLRLTMCSAPIAERDSHYQGWDPVPCCIHRDQRQSLWWREQLSLTLHLFFRKTATFWDALIPTQIYFQRSIFLVSILKPRCRAGTRASGLKVRHSLSRTSDRSTVR